MKEEEEELGGRTVRSVGRGGEGRGLEEEEEIETI